jgi:hypothetical protein
MLGNGFNQKIFFCFLGLIVVSGWTKKQSGVEHEKNQWNLSAFTELGFEYIDNSYFSTTATQENIWNQEVKEVAKAELGFLFKPHKKMKLKFEVEFDRNDPQPKMKDFWLKINLKSKQKVKLGYFKNQWGRLHNTSKKKRLSLHKTGGQQFVKSSWVMERDLGVEYFKSFKQDGEGFSLSARGSADGSKNIFQNSSLKYDRQSFTLKLDYMGVLSEKKEYSLRLLNQLAAISTEFWKGKLLESLPRYQWVSEVFAGDDVSENLKSAIWGVDEKKYFVVLEQRHSLGLLHDFSFLKASQFVLGVSMLNPHHLRHFESVAGVNLHLTSSSSLIWKTEFLRRFVSQEGFTLSSSLQFFL